MARVSLARNAWTIVTTTTVPTLVQNTTSRQVYVSTAASPSNVNYFNEFLLNSGQTIRFEQGVTVRAFSLDAAGSVNYMEVGVVPPPEPEPEA